MGRCASGLAALRARVVFFFRGSYGLFVWLFACLFVCLFVHLLLFFLSFFGGE